MAEYEQFPGKTAYYGHGGDEIDSDTSAPTGLDVEQCEARCDSDSQCDCVSIRPADGKCWKRGNCVPSLFGADGNYDTYVKSSAPPPAPTPTPSPAAEVDATTLHWNAHRPCATDQASCISAAQSRLGQMASEVGAQIVGAVELKDAVKALPGWQSTGMQCDNSAVMVAPGWSIIKSGGYCMNSNVYKGFAVALVTPPQEVAGCQHLCVMMGHVPHEGVYSGGSEVEAVCGEVRASCMIGMGDWNADDISSRWGALVGGTTVLVEPHDKTCCYNSFANAFDHTATNIAGAYSAGKTVYPPQLTSFPSWNEHMPTSVKLRLPGAAVSLQSELAV